MDTGRQEIPAAHRAIAWWLLTVSALVFAMVVLGGVTRLTESGLSMVTWKPVTGIIPPIGDQAWQAEFARYQAHPEFQKLNKWMSLEDFKSIFYFEYAHRVLGRLIGLAFFIPFLVFLVRRQIPRALTPKLAAMFLLGGLQGLMGWYMVKSGLVDNPDVSHYRLTAHLALAFLVYGFMVWVALDLLLPRPDGGSGALVGLVRLFLALVGVQVLLGGLTAGLDAGFMLNTWPLMGDSLIPPGLWSETPWAMNFVENPVMVQFIHRLGAYVLVVLAGVLWGRGRKADLGPRGRLALDLLFGWVLVQTGLGIATLVYTVPVALGAIHQGGAVVLYTLALFAAHQLRPCPQPA